jgi:hypothetical protein
VIDARGRIAGNGRTTVAEDLREPRGEWADDVEATMLAARVLVAISAQSVAAVDDVLTAPQLRVLVMIASRGPLKLGAVARGRWSAPVERDSCVRTAGLLGPSRSQ